MDSINYDKPAVSLPDCKKVYDECSMFWYYNQQGSYKDCSKLFETCKKLMKVFKKP